MPTMTFPDDDPTYGFLRDLAPLFGSPIQALRTFVQSSPEFQLWADKTALCPHCQRYVPVWLDRDRPVLDAHRTRNPHSDRPYWIPCPGEGQPARLQHIDTASLTVARAHIEHRVNTIQPGLL